jgi:hypothetical protein
MLTVRNQDTVLLSGSLVVEILTDEKPSDTQRSGELRFYFMPLGPDRFAYRIWAPSKGFTGCTIENVARPAVSTFSVK